ncbi:MAG: glycosyltransferase [Endomicrobia bacterium]|nr:glycosyltransferase [Endomicrobiia bacterium]
MNVSVIIPTYNRGHILSKVLPTYFHDLVYEIIIVDDGSNDNTKEEVEKIYFVYPKIKYIKHYKKLGPTYARNTGIINTHKMSHYIFFGEDDVVLTPKTIDILFNFIEKEKLDIIGCAVKYLHKNEDYKKYVVDEYKIIIPKTVSELFKLKAIQLGRKNIYQQLMFDTEYILNSYREETDFYLRAIKSGYKIGLIESYLAFNLPREDIGKGGHWDLHPIVYEISTLYNNLRFWIKHFKFIKRYFDLTNSWIIKEQLKFVIERMRALKSKLCKL